MKLAGQISRRMGMSLLGAGVLVLTLTACTQGEGRSSSSSGTASAPSASPSTRSSAPGSGVQSICTPLAAQLEVLNFFPSLVASGGAYDPQPVDADFHKLQNAAPDGLRPSLEGLDGVMEAAIKKPSGFSDAAFADAKIKVENWSLKNCS